MRTHIVQMLDFLPAFGGVNSFVSDLCKSLFDFGQDVILIGLMKGKGDIAIINELENYGIRVYCFNFKGKEESVVYGPPKLRRLLKSIIGNDLAILNLHLKLSVLVGALATIGINNIICVETYHSNYRNYFGEYRVLSGRIQKYICCSDSAREEFAMRFKPNNLKICTISNGINLQEIYSLSSKRNVLQNELKKMYFLSVGRLSEQKNFMITAHAFGNLPMGLYEYKIVGDGPQKAALEEVISKSNKEVLVKMLPRKQIIEELIHTDMVVIPSLWEGLSIFLLEAMAIGCPLMMSDVPSLRNVVGAAKLKENETWKIYNWGYIVSVNDINAYREAALHYIAHPELKSVMSANVRSISSKYDIKETAKRYISIYEEIFEKTQLI